MPNIIVIMPSVSSARQHMAARLGFESVSELDKWEEDIAIDHFANFICDYLAHGYTVQPDMRELVDYIDLEKAVAERINMLEQRRFEQVLDPDKSECGCLYTLIISWTNLTAFIYQGPSEITTSSSLLGLCQTTFGFQCMTLRVP